VLQTDQVGPCAFCTNDRLRDDDCVGHPVVWEFQNTFNQRWYLWTDKAIPWPGGSGYGWRWLSMSPSASSAP
jgi:hypothetical protein